MQSEELFQKGQELFLENKFQESIGMFNKAVEAGYDAAAAHLSMGAAYMNEAQYDAAMGEFNKVVEVDRENDRAYFYRGIAYMNKGDFPCAIADLTHSIDINRDRPETFLARGIARAEAEKEEEALEDFKRVAAYSEAEVRSFGNQFGSTMTSFDRTMALLEGERGPWSRVLTPEEMEKLKKWMN